MPFKFQYVNPVTSPYRPSGQGDDQRPIGRALLAFHARRLLDPIRTFDNENEALAIC
jgi:hypothetical protein